MGAARKTPGIGKSQLGKRHFPQCASYTRPVIFSSLCVKIRPYFRLGLGTSPCTLRIPFSTISYVLLFAALGDGG